MFVILIHFTKPSVYLSTFYSVAACRHNKMVVSDFIRFPCSEIPTSLLMILMHIAPLYFNCLVHFANGMHDLCRDSLGISKYLAVRICFGLQS